MAKTIKEIDSEIKVIMGGPHASFFPKEVINAGFVDVVCMFEGEITLIELMKYFDGKKPSLKEIQGIAYKINGTSVVNEKRKFIQDLDTIPFPARHLFPMDKYWGDGSIITARGCPYSCIFCSARAMHGGICRFRSKDNVVEEMEQMIKNFKIKEFSIVDDTFTASKKHVLGICDQILERLDITWSCDSRVDTFTKELATAMYKAGCRTIHFGIESGNNEVLKKIRKNISVEQAKCAVKLANNIGFEVICDFIIGHPFDTEETVLETLKLAKKLKSLENNGGPEILIHFSILAPAPGSYLFEHAEELGVKIVSPDINHVNDILIRTRNLTRNDLRNFFLEGLKVSGGM